MDSLKKFKIVTAVAGVLTAGLLTASIVSLALSPKASADTSGQPGNGGGGGSIEIQVDPEMYDGFMAMLRYYKNLENQPPVENTQESAAIAKNGDSYCIIINGAVRDLDDESVEIVETADGIYIIVDGKLYKLYTPDGSDDPGDVSDVLGQAGVTPPGGGDNPGGTDPNHPGGTDPNNPGGGDDDNPGGGTNPGTGPLGFDDNGEAIIAYDDDGKPIIGYNDDGSPIYGYDNPRIHYDSEGNKYYHIIWGDTLCWISRDVHMTVEELGAYNRIRNVNLIYANSDILIPNDRDWTEPGTDREYGPWAMWEHSHDNYVD